MRSGTVKRLDEVTVGDEVQVTADTFSPVFFFGHKDPDSMTEFVRITISTEQSILLSAEHMIPSSRGLLASHRIQVGDFISDAGGHWRLVTTIGREVHRGLFMPHTAQGTIVVNGIIASTFNSFLSPPLAQALLLPERLAFHIGASVYGSLLHGSRPALLDRALILSHSLCT